MYGFVEIFCIEQPLETQPYFSSSTIKTLEIRTGYFDHHGCRYLNKSLSKSFKEIFSRVANIIRKRLYNN